MARHTEESLSALTLKGLKELAEGKNLTAYKSLRKAELVQMLLDSATPQKKPKAKSATPVVVAAASVEQEIDDVYEEETVVEDEETVVEDEVTVVEDEGEAAGADEAVDVFGYISTKEPFNPFATSFGVINLFLVLEFVNLVVRPGTIANTSDVGFYPPFSGKFYSQEYYQHVLSWFSNLIIAPLVIGVIFNSESRSSYSALVFSVSRYIIYHFFGDAAFLVSAFDYIPADLFVASCVLGVVFSFWDHIKSNASH